MAEIEHPGLEQMESVLQAAISKMLRGNRRAKIIVDRYWWGEHTLKGGYETRPKSFFLLSFHLEDGEESTETVTMLIFSEGSGSRNPLSNLSGVSNYYICDGFPDAPKVLDYERPVGRKQAQDALRDRFQGWITARRFMEVKA